ncbi:MAG: Beta-barrel assembly-enhancing protease [Chlamydiales bacterium]|nr:Beta-barrel assembly-enhancing protease [Chlamydiales bacterium]MCH9619643.1 Beta-barrel assembly-enhancing protease [Chlamydiales bacterium]MCH9623249.1 Beta-barrel assembly-enhancing protease [Chlamydiales bacterium]
MAFLTRLPVFIVVVLLTIAFISYLSVRHWIRNYQLTAKTIQKSLNSASYLITLGKWDEAKNILLPLLHHAKGGAKVHLYYVQALQGAHSYDEALHLVKYASKLYPEELLLRLEEGKILLELEQPEEALQAFKVCSPILRSESDIHTLALALLRGGHTEQSWHLIEKRLDQTKNGELIVLGGEILIALKNYTEAIHLFKKAEELGYNHRYLVSQLAHAYRKLGNLSEAEHLYRKLLEKDPADVNATLGLGKCMEERGHFQKAFLIYQSSHAWKKKDRRLIKQTAFCALYTKKYSYAEHYFYELSKSFDPSPSILSYYGYSLERQKKWQKAEQVYLETIRQFPDKPNGYRGAAWLFGVGLNTVISDKEGLNFAHITVELLNDATSWSILSAVEARVGNFERAYQIQEGLLSQDEDEKSQRLRKQVLRRLRNNYPLEGEHVASPLVA